jgi:DNA mismatch endonuclease Vsr
MSRIKGKNTRPEMVIRKWLWRNGFRYRLHNKNLPGRPDIVFSGKKRAIFINGCFWHRHNCKYFRWPATNKAFWKKKINDNVRRDSANNSLLKEKGWKFIIIWECQIRKNIDKVHKTVSSFLK